MTHYSFSPMNLHLKGPYSYSYFYNVYITPKYSFLCPFPLMCFKQCFMEVFFNKFACIHGEKMSNFKSRKKRENHLFVLFFFNRTFHFDKRHDMIQ